MVLKAATVLLTDACGTCGGPLIDTGDELVCPHCDVAERKRADQRAYRQRRKQEANHA